MAARVARQVVAVHVLRAPPHHRPREHVFAERFLHEAGRRNDLRLAAANRLGIDYGRGTAEMIDVAVREDHRENRAFAERAIDECQRRGGRFGGRQRVDQNAAVRRFDDAHVRDVVTAHLKDAVSDFEQPVRAIQFRLTPQRRIDARRRIAGDERVCRRVPDDAAVLGFDDQRIVLRDETPVGRVEIHLIGQRELSADRGVRLGRETRRLDVAVGVCAGRGLLGMLATSSDE